MPAVQFDESLFKSELEQQLRQCDEPTAWLNGLSISLQGSKLQVVFAHDYFSAWFQAHKKTLFENLVFRLFNIQHTEIIYKINQNKPDAPVALENRIPVRDAASGEDAFADFIFNGKNAGIIAILKNFAAECDKGVSARNCLLVLCGNNGSGKSHLLHGLYKSLSGDRFHVLHTQAHSFCSSFNTRHVSAAFWQRYHSLLLDDIQEIVNDECLQNLLASCIESGPGRRDRGSHCPRMVLTMCGQPAELKCFSARLLSRLECALVLELQEPDLDVRLRYAEKINSVEKLGLGREQILTLARRCPRITQLQGILRKIALINRIKGKNSLQLDNLFEKDVKNETWRDILERTAQHFELQPDKILSAGRNPAYVRARQIAMYLCRSRLGLSYTEIGKLFGGRDHSTVMHGIKKIAREALADKDTHNLLTKLERKAVF